MGGSTSSPENIDGPREPIKLKLDVNMNSANDPMGLASKSAKVEKVDLISMAV